MITTEENGLTYPDLFQLNLVRKGCNNKENVPPKKKKIFPYKK